MRLGNLSHLKWITKIIRRGYNKIITPIQLTNQHQILVSTGIEELKFVPNNSNKNQRSDGHFSICMQNIQAHFDEIIFKETQILKNVNLIISISKNIQKRSIFDFLFGPGTAQDKGKYHF